MRENNRESLMSLLSHVLRSILRTRESRTEVRTRTVKVGLHGCIGHLECLGNLTKAHVVQTPQEHDGAIREWQFLNGVSKFLCRIIVFDHLFW